MNTQNTLLLDKFNQDLWYLRVALDVYAVATDVPLRVYRREPLLQFYTDACQVNEKFKIFLTESAFHEKVTEWTRQSPAEVFKEINELGIAEVLSQLAKKYGDHWYFYQSNEHPMIRMFAEYQTWQWWEFCIFYDLFVVQSVPTEPQCKNYGFGDKMHISYCWVAEMQSFVVAGPVWKLNEEARTGESFEAIVEPVVRQFIDTIQEIGDENLSSKKDRLIRLGNSRFSVSEINLTGYLVHVADALRAFTGIHVAEQFELTGLHRSDYVKLAEWALFLIKTIKMVEEFYLPTVSPTHPPHLPPLCQSDVFCYFVKEFDGKSDKFHVKTQFSCDLASMKIIPSMELLCDDLTLYDCGEQIPNTHLLTKSSTKSSNSFLERLGISFSRFLHDVLTKQNSGRAEYLSYLRIWLDDRFGTLTDEENNDLSNERKLENQLAKRISWFLHADITTLYRYDYGKESLETLGVYCGTSQRDEWIQQVPAQMKQIHIDPDKREKSICYRCVDTEEIRFCRNFDSDHPENTEPQNETLLSPEQLDSHKSGLAVPMLVHNRVWGVVEILGTRPHQFRWDDRRFVSELGETLSPFFYHQWLLKKLQQLNKIAVNEKETPEGYDKICQCLAELLMSYGAAIWVYESQAGGYYKCKGVYQRQWNQQPSLRDEKIYLSDKESVIIYTREEVRQHPEKVWWEKHLDELPPQWKDLQRNHPLIEKGIKSIACIPIYSSQQQEHQETIAYIVLYNKADRKYDERWKHYFGFVARYTAIVLEAIQAQTVLERRSRRFVRHEIKSNVNQISDRVSELKRFYQKDFHERQSHISKDFLRRYDLLIGDLETYARYLQDDVEYLAEKNFVKYMQSESPIAAHIQDKIASGEQPSWLDLRQAFNVNFRAAWILQKKKQLTGIYTSHRPFTGIHTSHRPFTSIYTSHRSLYVRIHEYSLHHILGNLCDNAIKYATEGSTIRIGETEIDGSLEWSISNVGECLGEHEQDRIFEEEARGSNAKNEGGEGKGLFIVRGVCELYGIAVRYDTEPAAKGNCLHKFTLSFPPQMIKAT